MKTENKISIIIPTFNRSFLLKKTLNSVIEQSYSLWECIVIDDGSTDDTITVLTEFSKKDERIFFFKRPVKIKKGAASCRNYGFRKSNGEYIQWLDDDDILSKDKLQFQILKLRNLNSNKLAICDWDLFWDSKIYESNNILKKKESINKFNFFDELAIQQTFVPIHSYLMSRELINKAGLWNIDLTLNDDAEFMARIIVFSDGLINSQNCYVLYRDSGLNRLSSIQTDDALNSNLKSLKLIYKVLSDNKINSRKYLRWKLIKIFIGNWSQSKLIIKKYKELYKVNGLNLVFSEFYLIKYKLYKIFYPFYKKIFK